MRIACTATIFVLLWLCGEVCLQSVRGDGFEGVVADWSAGKWSVYGYSAEVDQWTKWEIGEKEARDPDLPWQYTKGFATNGKLVALMNRSIGEQLNGYLLDTSTGQFRAIPEIPVDTLDGMHYQAINMMSFVGSDLAVVGARPKGGHVAILDSESLQWRVDENLPISLREERSIFAVSGKHIILWGGFPNPNDLGIVYDSDAVTWKSMSDSPFAFSGQMHGVEWNNGLAVFDWNERIAWRYDIVTEAWLRLDLIPFAASDVVSATVAGSNLFVFCNPKTATSYIWDLSTKKFREVAPSGLRARDVAWVYPIGSDKFLVAGGWDGRRNQFRRDCSIYDAALATRRNIKDIPAEISMSIHPGW